MAQGMQGTRQEHPNSMGHMGCQGSTQTAREGTGPKERKDQGRAVEAAADHAQALGFRGPMFHFNSAPRAGVFPSDPPALTPEPPAQGFPAGSISSPCDGAVSGGSPGGAAQGHPSEEQPAEGVNPQPRFFSLEARRKAELGAEGASGPGSDTSQIREVCGLEPKHRMCSAEEGLGEGAL